MAVKPKKKPRRRRVSSGSRGLTPSDVGTKEMPDKIAQLTRDIEADGGKVLACYREPLGENWQLLAALPISKVKPTDFQRDLSDTHMKRLADKIDRLERYLDPITVVRTEDGEYLTPNGNHRRAAMSRLGAKSIIAMVIPDFDVAYQILALNTEKAYNLKEKSLEAIRMARTLADTFPSSTEEGYGAEFEEPYFLTLGLCYEKHKRFSGGAYSSVLRKTESFADDKISKSLKERQERAERVLKLDAGVAKKVEALKRQGLKSPYLKTFVVARINPLRFSPAKTADFDKTLEKMEDALEKLDPKKIQAHHLSGMAGAPIDDT